MVLDNIQIDKGSSDLVNKTAESAVEAVWDISDSHVWSSNGKKVADLDISATLSNVSCNKGTLRKSNNIDLSCTSELLMGEEVCATFLGLFLEIFKD